MNTEDGFILTMRLIYYMETNQQDSIKLNKSSNDSCFKARLYYWILFR